MLEMIYVYVNKQKNYPVSTLKIKSALRSFFKKRGIISDADVTVSLVGDKKMASLSRKYLKEDGVLHNVLSFPFIDESKEFRYPPENMIHLGDIVICYSKVIEEAKKENKLIEQKVLELVEHGAMHLLGTHHE